MMWRWLRRIVLIPLLLACAYIVCAIGLNTVSRGMQPVGAAAYVFFACDNGVHVDLALPVVSGGRNWRKLFPPSDFSGDIMTADFVSVGWGARGFFATTPHWRDIRPGPVIRALLWLDSSVLHVAYHGDPGATTHCRRLTTDAAGRNRLFAFIDETLFVADGRALRDPIVGYGPYDGFYAARGRYSLFRTCNVWSAEALFETGQEMGLWSPFSFQVMNNLSQLAAN
jgi:uncharacterized protein (TIGR02117 family)